MFGRKWSGVGVNGFDWRKGVAKPDLMAKFLGALITWAHSMYLGHYLGTNEFFFGSTKDASKIASRTLMEKIWCELCWKVCSSGRKTFSIWLLFGVVGKSAANLLIVVVILAIKIIHNMWREILAWWTKFSTPNHHFCSFFVLSQNRDTRYHHNKTLIVSFASFIAFARTSFVCKYFFPPKPKNFHKDRFVCFYRTVSFYCQNANEFRSNFGVKQFIIIEKLSLCVCLFSIPLVPLPSLLFVVERFALFRNTTGCQILREVVESASLWHTTKNSRYLTAAKVWKLGGVGCSWWFNSNSFKFVKFRGAFKISAWKAFETSFLRTSFFIN